MGGGDRFVLQVYVGTFSNLYEALSIEASKQTTAEDIVECIAEKLSLKEANIYELAEVVGNEGGQDCKERRIGLTECPVALQLLWPKKPANGADDATSAAAKSRANDPSFSGPEYRFCLRRKLMHSMNWSFSWTDSNDSQLLKDYFLRFLYQPRDREYPDLCQLPDLTEQTLLENLKVSTTVVCVVSCSSAARAFISLVANERPSERATNATRLVAHISSSARPPVSLDANFTLCSIFRRDSKKAISTHTSDLF